jgi:uncharacterized protein
MKERDFSFVSAGPRLAGTLATPDGAGPFACVVMLTGSGEVDRDENAKKLRINVFGELAHYLAARGLASVRYDKRGVGQSQGDHWKTGFYDHVADAEEAVRAVEARAAEAGLRPDQIYLLGHSEGAYIATHIAASSGRVAGIILLAGGARSGEEELRWQARKVTDALTGFNALVIRVFRIDPLKAQAKHLEKIKRSNKDSYRVQLVQRINAKWMREFLAYDPAEDLPRIEVPVLAITGAKDIQVDPANLERMAELVKAPFEAHVVPDVTHLLRSEAGPGGLGTYKEQVKRPVDPRVLALVADWLQRQTGQMPKTNGSGGAG